jgi:hypothetical protein
MMEAMLTIKFALFVVIELLVVGVLGAAVIAGLYQIVKRSMQHKEVVPAGRSHLPTRAG